MRFDSSPRCRHSLAGFSFAEVMVVITILAIIAAVSISSLTNTFSHSRETVAETNLNLLNLAVGKYNHAASELTNADENGMTSESAVIALLKTRDASIVGSPFLDSNVNVRTNSSADSYRAKWNGRAFERLDPGTNGTGIDLLELTRR